MNKSILAFCAVCLSLGDTQAFTATPSSVDIKSRASLSRSKTKGFRLSSSSSSDWTLTTPNQEHSNDNHFPPGSTLVLTDPETNCEVVLLGCFHGSASSAEDVTTCLNAPILVDDGDDTEKTKQSTKNVVVALELCATRFTDLRRDVEKERQEQEQGGGAMEKKKRDKPWVIRFAEMVKSTIEQRGLSTGLAAALLGGVSGIQTALSGLQPGLEFRTALCHVLDLEANNNNHDDNNNNVKCQEMTIVLADKNVDETLDSIGQIPKVAFDLWADFLSSPIEKWPTTFGIEAAALGNALGLVIEEDNEKDDTSLQQQGGVTHVTLGGFAIRSPTAIRDLVRLMLPPIAFLQGSVVAINVAFEWLQNQPEWIEAASSAAASSGGDAVPDAWYWSNLFFMTSLYMSVALPAVRVILRERDDILTSNIREACRLATRDGSQAGRVVAVLGLLHVNGVARRLLTEQPNENHHQETMG